MEQDLRTWIFRDVDCWVSEKGREKDIRDELGPGMLAVRVRFEVSGVHRKS